MNANQMQVYPCGYSRDAALIRHLMQTDLWMLLIDTRHAPRSQMPAWNEAALRGIAEMKSRSRLSERTLLNPPDQTYSWLEEKVYAKKRERTVALVMQGVEQLGKEKGRVSLATIASKSREIDPDGLGVSETAILHNPEACAYYKQHRTWKGTSKRRAGNHSSSLGTLEEPPIELQRDPDRARQRYLRMSKQELVDRLLTIEQLYVHRQERWLQSQDELLTWQLRAEKAEARLKQEKQTS